MYDLTQLTANDFDHFRQQLLLTLKSETTCMEAAANAVVHMLQTTLGNTDTNTSDCVLVRCYVTQRYEKLEPRLQDLAHHYRNQANIHAIKYLTLLASAGDRPEWHDRTLSKQHQLIPLISVDTVHQLPMIARMITQFGFNLDTLVAADAVELSMLANRTHNIFYVPAAVGSPYIPAQQEFVLPYGVKSVLGIGGILPYGNMFSLILFARVPIPKHVATMFAALAVDIKTAFARYGDKRIFAASA